MALAMGAIPGGGAVAATMGPGAGKGAAALLVVPFVSGAGSGCDG